MTDLSVTIDPKSDQLNSDDLIAGPRTITVTRVTGTSDREQPIAVYFQGDNGKPYKPGKSMRRVLVQLWGKNGDAYVGRSMTLFRDQHVKFGGIEVGGIRISHMSHIEADAQLALTVTRGKRDPYTVRRLVVKEREKVTLEQAIKRIRDASDVGALRQTAAALRDEQWTEAERAAIAQAIEATKQGFTHQREPGDEG